MRADAVAKREAIITAAWRLFSDEGTTEVSMRAVAVEAGVGMGTLYRHFASRHELLLGIADEVHGRVMTICSAHRQGWDDDAERVWRSFAAEMAVLRLGALGPRLSLSLEKELVTPHVLALRDEAIGSVAEILGHAAAAGLVPPGLHPLRFNIALGTLTRPLPRRAGRIVPGQQDWTLRVFLAGLRALAPEPDGAGGSVGLVPGSGPSVQPGGSEMSNKTPHEQKIEEEERRSQEERDKLEKEEEKRLD